MRRCSLLKRSKSYPSEVLETFVFFFNSSHLPKENHPQVRLTQKASLSGLVKPVSLVVMVCRRVSGLFFFLNVHCIVLLITTTPWKTNIEPENHLFEKENNLPNLHFWVPC